MEGVWNKDEVWRVEEVVGGRQILLQLLFLWHSIRILELWAGSTVR